MPALLKRLAPLLDLGIPTAFGSTLAEVAARAEIADPDIIRPLDAPLAPTGGIAVLRGNLAPEGAVVKVSGIAPTMMRHTGPARAFDREEDVQECLMGGRVRPGDMLVVRYEGPRGGPGMRELSLPAAIMVGMGLADSVAMSPMDGFRALHGGHASGMSARRPPWAGPWRPCGTATSLK